MAPSAIATASPPTSTPESAENNLQPFFVLHKASGPKLEEKSALTTKTRRRIDLTPSKEETSEECDDLSGVSRRMEAFEIVWEKIESTVKDVLRDININMFNEIYKWVCESFNTVRSFGMPSYSEATRSFPMVTNATCKILFTGFVLTKNMEFVDDLLTFEELGSHLKSHGCHVAKLSSLDFSVKNGIGGCLRSLLRQFLMVTLDVADISILATWYREQGNYNNPVVIIIDDMERCCGSVLSDFILMLSEWVLKIPVILIMGVATTLDASRSLLRSNALHHLCPCKFMLGTPSERLDAVVEAVLVKQCSGFNISHQVAVSMRNYFVSQDGTITSFIKALKIACAQHFFMEPLSFLLLWFLLGDDSEVLQGEKYALSREMMLKHALNLPSYQPCGRNKIVKQHGETLEHALSELKKLQRQWSIVTLCLYEAGKYDKIRLLDLFCEALDPESYNSRACATGESLENDYGVSSSDCYTRQRYHSSQNGRLICQAVHNLRDLPAVHLCKLLKDWERHTSVVPAIHDRVKKLLSELKSEDGKSMRQDLSTLSKKSASRKHLNIEGSKANEKAVKLLESMIRSYMQPIECIAFHEIVCFKDVDKLQMALIGDPRRRIQIDLLESHKIIQCSCCRRSDKALLPSMHDSSIMYNLVQEHGDLINLHDWYQSFKTVVLSSSNKRKHRPKYSPSPKKRKATTEPAKPSEASIQARFCRAVMELQVTGLLRMPSKRRPDFVQRVAFGL